MIKTDSNLTKIDSLRAWLLAKVGTGYVYGATGWVCSEARRMAQAKQYPAYANTIMNTCKKWDGKVCHDCAQLTRKAMAQVGISLPSGATSQWKADVWAAKGTIESLPQDRLCLLFMQDGAKMKHVLVYLGDGRVVDARGSASGVVLSKLGAYKATHWAIPKGLYEDLGGVTGMSTRDTIRRGARGATVVEAQGLLMRAGYPLPKHGADGDFGAETESAACAFQAAHGLAADGVIGPATWAALDKAAASIPDEDEDGDGGAEDEARMQALIKELQAVLDRYRV